MLKKIIFLAVLAEISSLAQSRANLKSFLSPSLFHSCTPDERETFTCTEHIDLPPPKLNLNITIQSPNYPDYFNTSLDKVICFHSPNKTGIQIFCKFSLENPHTRCYENYLFFSTTGTYYCPYVNRVCGTGSIEKYTLINILPFGLHADDSGSLHNYECEIFAFDYT